VSTKAG